MVHPLHYLLLTVHYLVWTFFENMAFEVIFVIGLPRLRTHVAETFTASASHKVAAHRSLDCFLTPWANFSVGCDPFGISLLRQYLLQPFFLLLAFARIVVITLTSEAKDFTAHTLNRINCELVNLDAVSTVSSSTKLIVPVGCYEQLAQFFLVFLPPTAAFLPTVPKNQLYGFKEKGGSTVIPHAAQERVAGRDAAFDVAEPAFYAIAVTTYVAEDGDGFTETNIAGFVELDEAVFRVLQILIESDRLLVLVHVIVILFLEKFLVPFELFEQKQTPTFAKVYDRVDFIEDEVKFEIYFLEREYFVWLVVVVKGFVVAAVALNIFQVLGHLV